MTQEQKGHCKHGEFSLIKGCPQCIEEHADLLPGQPPIKESKFTGVPFGEGVVATSNDGSGKSIPVDTNIVKVAYYSDSKGTSSGREYSYFSHDVLKVGQYVMVPVRDRMQKAIVTAINVPESEFEAFRESIKTIPSESGSLVAAAKEAGAEVTEADVEFKPIEEGPAKEEWKGIKPLLDEPYIDQEGETVVPNGITVLPQGLEVGTALVKVQPQLDMSVQDLYRQSVALEEYAQAMVIDDLASAKQATNDLSIISGIKKAIDEKRREYVGPIKKHLQAVEDAFKTFMDPLIQSNKSIKDKMGFYNAESARKRREEEQINQMRMKAAQKEMELKGELTASVDLIPVSPVTSKTVRTDMGTASSVDNWKYEVIDLALLPDTYKVADHALLSTVAKNHHDQKPIPGVRFYNEPYISVRPR